MKASVKIGSKDKWETISSGGFSPLWKPEKSGESVIIRPVASRIIPAKGKRKDSPAIDCIFLGGSSRSFYQQDKQVPVSENDFITLPLSFNLEGEDKLAVATRSGKKLQVRLSAISEAVKKEKSRLNIIFLGRVKGGQGTVKQFTIAAPQGFRDSFIRRK